MTKTVQANVLRAYQPGEQYASGEICTYNGAPAYVNTALAQGVTGSASNFTNISNGSVYRMASAGDISITEGSNPMVIYMNSFGITTITINITQAGLIDLNKLIKIRLIGIGFIGSTAGAASIVLAYSGFPAGSNRNVLVRRSSTDSIGTNITGASGTSSGLSIPVLAGETIDITITGGQSTNDSIYIDAATNSQSRVLDENFTIGKRNSTFGHKFSIPSITDNRTITLPDANVDLGQQLISSSYSTSTGEITFGKANGTNTTVDMSRVRRYVDLPPGIAPEQPNISTLFNLNGSTEISIGALVNGKSWEFQSSLDVTLTLTKGTSSTIMDNEGNVLADSLTSSYAIALARYATIKVTAISNYWVVDYGPGRLFARSQSLGLVSTAGPGAGQTKYKTTFVRSSGSGFTSDVTVTIPDSNVDLGLVGSLTYNKITPVDSGSSTLQSNKLYHLGIPLTGVSSYKFILPSAPVSGDVIEIHDNISVFGASTSLIFSANKNFTFPIGVTGSVTGSAPNIEWTDTRRATCKMWKFTYFSDYGGSWKVEESDSGGCRSPELSIMRKANSLVGVVPNIDAVSGTDKTITYPNANVNLGNVAQAASTSATGYLTSADWNTFNNKLGLSDVRYQFVSDPDPTYIVPASAVTAAGRTIIELSNNSLTSITINTATGTDKVAGDSVNISITGTYAAQELEAGAGVTLQGDLTFSYQYQTKTLIYKGSNTWKVVG